MQWKFHQFKQNYLWFNPAETTFAYIQCASTQIYILNKCSTIILSQIGLDFKDDNIFSIGMAFGPTMPANYDEQTSIANVSKIDCNIKRLNMQKYLLQYRLYMY